MFLLHLHFDLNDHHIYHQQHLIEYKHDLNYLETLVKQIFLIHIC